MLKTLHLRSCDKLMGLICNGPLTILEALTLVDCPCLNSLPDLSIFQGLEKLCFRGFEKLVLSTYTGRQLY
jgi:hypothetical protein